MDKIKLTNTIRKYYLGGGATLKFETNGKRYMIRKEFDQRNIDRVSLEGEELDAFLSFVEQTRLDEGLEK